MIIYEATKEQFIDSVFNDKLSKKLINTYKKLNKTLSANEIKSIKNSSNIVSYISG